MTKKLSKKDEERKISKLVAALLALIAGSMTLGYTIFSQQLILFISGLFVTTVGYIYIIRNVEVSE